MDNDDTQREMTTKEKEKHFVMKASKKVQAKYDAQIKSLRIEMDLQLKYRHFRQDKNHHRGPVISVGWKQEWETDDILKITFAVSLCSKRDNFCRLDARNRINGRFLLGNTLKFWIKSPTLKWRLRHEGIVNYVKEYYNTMGCNCPAELGMKDDVPREHRYIR